MAMLRVSSYRKLFDYDNWSRYGGLGAQCAGQYQASVRSVWVSGMEGGFRLWAAPTSFKTGSSVVPLIYNIYIYIQYVDGF